MHTHIVDFDDHAPSRFAFGHENVTEPQRLALAISRSWHVAFQVCRVWRCVCHQRSGTCRLRHQGVMGPRGPPPPRTPACAAPSCLQSRYKKERQAETLWPGYHAPNGDVGWLERDQMVRTQRAFCAVHSARGLGLKRLPRAPWLACCQQWRCDASMCRWRHSAGHVKEPNLLCVRPIELVNRLRGGLQ
jgi:hypothetical protein